MYPSIFNRFLVKQAVSLKVRHFSTFLHIFLPPEYTPGTIAINFTRLERGFNACKTPRWIYPSVFNRFPVIQAWSLKVRHFSTFLHILASPVYAPETIAVNVTRLERGFNACKTPRCIFPSIFNRFWDSKLLVEICDIFVPQLCLAAPQGVTGRYFAKILIHTKLKWMSYRVAKKAWQHIQPFWYSTSVWRTDGRTEGQTDWRTSSLYLLRASA